MKRFLAILMTAAMAGGLLVAFLAGPSSAAGASCGGSANAPTANAGATLSGTGSGHCSGVASVTVQICVQTAFHNPGGTTWTSQACNSQSPNPGQTASFGSGPWNCSAGHTYAVRTRMVATGKNASGSTVASHTEFGPSKSGTNRTCHN